MGQRDDKDDRAEVDGQDPNFLPKKRLQKQRQQNSARAGGEHAEKDATGPEHCRHGKPEQDHRGQAEISEIVFQAAPQHLHDIRRAGDVNMKVARVQLMNDPQKARHRFLGHAAFHKDDDVAGLAVFGDEQSDLR